MGRRFNRKKHDATGRSDTSRFVRLDHRMVQSGAFLSLSPNARSLLIVLVFMYNGENNGSLYLSVRDAAYRMGVADLTAAQRAFDELVALRFIEMTEDAHFRVKAKDKSRARCWRLTWLPGPGRKAPDWSFTECEPEPQTPARKRMERGLKSMKAYRKARSAGKLPVLDSDTLPSKLPLMPAAPVLDSNTSNAENGANPPNRSVRDSATHIASTMGTAERGQLIGWWQPDWTPLIAPWSTVAILAWQGRAQPTTKRMAA